MINRLFGNSDPADQQRMASGEEMHQEPTGDDVQEQPHQRAGSSSVVSGRRTQERRTSTRRSRENSVISQCETRRQNLQAHEGSQRSGCGKRTH